MNKREQMKAAREKAMPAVKKLVTEHGLTAVGACIAKLKEARQLKGKAARLRAQATAIERRL